MTVQLEKLTETKQLQLEAVEVRMRTLQMIHNASRGHTGGSLSSVDILVALYFSVLNIDPEHPDDQARDRFILSKGHSVESYYAVLSRRGFFADSVLDTYGSFNSVLAGHPVRKIPGVELNSGALGHGLSVGVGMALAAKRQSLGFRIFVLMGDGEHGEGSIMEAAASAGHYKLDNLIAIIDRNKLQISGPTETVMSIEDLPEKYRACGWEVTETDGHDMRSLVNVLSNTPLKTGKPSCVIAHTVKGKGVSFMENKAPWHHKVPDEMQMKQAIKELEKMKKEINDGR
ncbi:MAG: transketolase [Bacteroidota bacterium]